MKKILIADPIHDAGKACLASQNGLEVFEKTGLDEDGLVAIIKDYDGLIVRSKTKVTARVIEAGHKLKVIGRAGIGTDNIDIPEATKRGIVVFNTPDANATTTAELAIAHMLSLSRHLPQADRSVRDNIWKPAQFVGTELASKTVAVIGFGTIGRLVAERCAGLKMTVLAYDPFVAPEIVSEFGAQAVSLDKALACADYVTLHCPLIDATRGLINANTLAKMKPGARLINCARGGLVVENDLVEALKSQHLSGAALDVFAKEPPVNSPLLALDNVVLTPHLGASTQEAQRVVAEKISTCVSQFLLTGEAEQAVNLPRISPEQLGKTEPYRRLAFSLGRLIGALSDGPISELVVRRFGKMAELDGRPIKLEALIGLLGHRLSERVNRVNATHLAQLQGISIREAKSDDARHFISLLEISATVEGKTTTVAGTLLGGRHPRLVCIDKFEVEAVPEGHLLLTRHEDKPGVVGALGGILGKAGINISRMQVGLANGSNMAMALIGISGSLPRAAMQEIEKIEAIQKVVQIEL